MGKGILLEREGRRGVVLTPQGEFKKVPVQPAWQVGDEVSFSEAPAFAWRRWVAFAVAAVLLVLLVPVGWQHLSAPQAVALITVDINPSVELGVDAEGRVISSRGLNADGEALLKAAGSLKGRASAEAVETLTAKAIELNKLDPTSEEGAVVVAVAPAQEELTEDVATALQEQAEQAAAKSLQEAARAKGQEAKAQVVSLAASAEVREQAKKDQVSVGKEALKQQIEAKYPDAKIDLETLKTMPPPKLAREIGKQVGVEIKLGDLLGKGADKGKGKGNQRDQEKQNDKKNPPGDAAQDDKKEQNGKAEPGTGKPPVLPGKKEDKGQDQEDKGKGSRGQKPGDEKKDGRPGKTPPGKDKDDEQGCIKLPLVGKVACQEPNKGKDKDKKND